VTPSRTLYTWAINWSLGIVAYLALSCLMSWMDGKQSETDAMRITAQVVNDRGAEFAAMRGPR
jgi:hypothetical protein